MSNLFSLSHFPFGAVPLTAARGAAGTWPGRAGAVIPPPQAALWRKLGEHAVMAARPRREEVEERVALLTCGVVDPGAPAGPSGAAGWNGGDEHNPRVVDEMCQKLCSCGCIRRGVPAGRGLGLQCRRSSGGENGRGGRAVAARPRTRLRERGGMGLEDPEVSLEAPEQISAKGPPFDEVGC